MAGSSFLRARSPVTPNMTSTQGPATRGMRRSRGSRSGLCSICRSGTSAGLAGAGPPPPEADVNDSLTILPFLCYRPGGRLAGRQGGPAARPPSPAGRLVELALDRLDELVPGRGELGHALIFQYGDHIVVGDT